jgi:hypothetical protein
MRSALTQSIHMGAVFLPLAKIVLGSGTITRHN